MKLSFCTLGCPEWDLETIARRGQEMGFDGVELRGVAGEHIGPDESLESRAAIRGLFAEHDMQVAAIMSYSTFTSTDAEVRRQNIATTVRFLQVARDLDCPVLRVFGGELAGQDRGAATETVASALRELAPQAEAAGVCLALETHDAWTVGNDVLAVVEAVDSPYVGVCWDVANTYFHEPASTTLKAIEAHLVHVHFKDAERRADGTIGSVLPGKGEVDMAGALQRLLEAGYAGWLSFEWEKKWEPALAEPEVAFPHFQHYTRQLLQELDAEA